MFFQIGLGNRLRTLNGGANTFAEPGADTEIE